MPERAAPHTWVEIHKIVLDSGERAPQAPDDTRQVPLEMTVKGYSLHEATIGEAVDIVTPSGRMLSGTLRAINPAYKHTFGPPIPELLVLGGEVRAILKDRGNAS